MLALYPGKVRIKKIKKKTPALTNLLTLKNGIKYIWLTKDLSKSGVIGDPTKATAERGQILFEVATRQLITFIQGNKAPISHRPPR